MISVCVPSRGRPKMFSTMLRSAELLAAGPFEVVSYLDDDDETADKYPQRDFVHYVRGPRIVQSDMWNKCWAAASGDIAMLGGDDMTFKTKKWNDIVQRHIDSVPDRLLMVYGNDGTLRHDPVLPFVSREWIDLCGFFTPPYFKSWMADRWIWEVAEAIDRDRYVRHLMIHHPTASQRKRMHDPTYADAETFRAEQDPKALYLLPEMLAERQEQAMRLCEAIHEQGAWSE